MKFKSITFLLSVITAIILLGVFLFPKSQAANAKAVEPAVKFSAIQADKPIKGWVVCKDLGIEPVPGVSGNRQRIRLCHAQGWIVDTYCLRPDLPVPTLGGTCERTGVDTYWCGNGLQPLKEYRVRQTPTPTPTLTATATSTLTPTATVTQTPTLTSTQPPRVTEVTVIPYPTEYPTPRPKPGGLGYRQLFTYAWNLVRQKPAAAEAQIITPTPFRPIHPTAIIPTEVPAPSQNPVLRQALQAPPIDLTPGERLVTIRIKPDSKKFHSGKSLKLSFRIGTDCEYGDGTACVNTYQDAWGAQISVVTVHSGLGGEAQSLRHALEGTGFDQAGLTIKEVKDNLQSLTDSTATITQGDQNGVDLQVLAAVRLPARQVKEYVELPISEILSFAARRNPELLSYVNFGEPLILIETCGWRMPGENVPAGLPNTSASIYLLVLGPAH